MFSYLLLCILYSYLLVSPRDLLSFPTRRSSDLAAAACCLQYSRRDAEGSAPQARWLVFSDGGGQVEVRLATSPVIAAEDLEEDRKSTRLNSSHVKISYAVFCLKKKTKYYELTSR